MTILGIETSCDETAAAVVQDGRVVLSNTVASSVEEQALYGGVVPEIASRRHIESISGVVATALKDAHLAVQDVDAVAVTAAPGLIGAVLVGVNFAKGLAFAAQKPLVPVHHLRGHVASLYLGSPALAPPFFCLVASGGHCHFVQVQGYTGFTVWGRTVDDAAGEAFDKVARALHLGYPGGPAIAKAAEGANPAAYPLPTPKTEGAYDVSFSGLKTAALNVVNTAAMKGEAVDIPALAASFQQKVADILCDTLFRAAQAAGQRVVGLAGGVAANALLREKVAARAAAEGMVLHLAPLQYSGDNAAMIAAQGYYEYLAGHTAGPGLNGYASWPMEEDFPG
ncbi:tRNA (adenosine(37)-N6)-threonylcarbamoyltransferase complex transferase subunit TsaD [Ruminococcaceae bacterium OttesenSCG-928-O06]|nr:tRNA (adenosine(37)-N6)-threonylcarbamoyltransferase complex transferase subunit TsaD [Ruminococcaceae bacterium OttesenSCG-928-O06]